MSKHEKKTSSLLHYPVLVVFSLFFIGLFALDMVTPDRSYSELENTTLSQHPAVPAGHPVHPEDLPADRPGTSAEKLPA